MSFHFTKQVEVRFRDCDPMGHVNNAVFATYFEIARAAYWRDALGYTSLDDCAFIIARIECNYRSQARLGDRLDVRARIGHIGNSSFAFEYEVVEASDGRRVADGRSVQVMFDYEAQRSRPVPADFKARVARFEA
jgi:acyl-CoA thioester hydrolase